VRRERYEGVDWCPKKEEKSEKVSGRKEGVSKGEGCKEEERGRRALVGLVGSVKKER